MQGKSLASSTTKSGDFAELEAAEVFYYSVIINVGFKISGFSDEYFKYSGALVAFLLMSI